MGKIKLDPSVTFRGKTDRCFAVIGTLQIDDDGATLVFDKFDYTVTQESSGSEIAISMTSEVIGG